MEERVHHIRCSLELFDQDFNFEPCTSSWKPLPSTALCPIVLPPFTLHDIQCGRIASNTSMKHQTPRTHTGLGLHCTTDHRPYAHTTTTPDNSPLTAAVEPTTSILHHTTNLTLPTISHPTANRQTHNVYLESSTSPTPHCQPHTSKLTQTAADCLLQPVHTRAHTATAAIMDRLSNDILMEIAEAVYGSAIVLGVEDFNNL